ncbi:HisA/HisF-related TIM barrel protein [uncultured Lamprocystis sp.]|jgi:cyclase|uniref:HisA/HisF-related TIM barrel protein n=1 Tax=uncultured Lamprocystis sp. TaxID=543132 RepID=UPI0025D4F080|nr:HisA/HisF-related TIM barrel protein [uncultured Lamprocystis sp.]
MAKVEVKTVEQIERLISLGIEKVALGSAAVDEPRLVARAAERVGSQSIVGVIDVKTFGLMRRKEVVVINASRRTGKEPAAFARELEALGVGEIVLNSVDRDGKLNGYDIDLVNSVRREVTVPLTVLGGAGSMNDICTLVAQHPVIGAAAGSLFVFKGKYRAVLINYPSREEREALIRRQTFVQNQSR